MMGILGEGCWGWSHSGWSCQERGNGEGQKGGLIMDVVKEDMAKIVEVTEEDIIQKIGTNVDRKSAVATPDGKAERRCCVFQCMGCLLLPT